MYWLAESGTPLQTQMSEKGIPFYPFGRGDMGRTAAYNRTDLYIQHGFTLFGGQRISLGLNIENLFDQDIVTRRFTTRYRDSFNVSDQAFFSGTFDPVAMATAAPGTYRPIRAMACPINGSPSAKCGCKCDTPSRCPGIGVRYQPCPRRRPDRQDVTGASDGKSQEIGEAGEQIQAAKTVSPISPTSSDFLRLRLVSQTRDQEASALIPEP